jgi:hypothetical protein
MQHLLGQPAPRSESLAPAAIVLQRHAGEAPARRGANHRAPGPRSRGRRPVPTVPITNVSRRRYWQLKESRELKAAQMRQIGVKAMDCSAELCHGNPIWEPTMTQPLTLDDQRAIARRLFEALCAKYPERYIALIQPRDTAADGLSAPDITAVESSPASLS